MHCRLSVASNKEDDLSTSTILKHPHLTAQPCDENRHYLLPHHQAPPPPEDNQPEWFPFKSQIDFDFAYQHFIEVQNSEGSINKAIEWWAAALLKHEDFLPWTSVQELYETIDNIQMGNTPWKTYKIHYEGPLPPETPKWMTETYKLVTRDALQLIQNQLLTTDFKKDVTPVPYQQFDKEGQQVWSNLMSGDWAYKQVTDIAKDPNTHGAMFVPIVAGSDKTTVSVATGHQEYHPVYMSPGILTNPACCARGTGVLPVVFLPIPKANHKQHKMAAFQKFSRQMYHTCLACVFAPLKPTMTTPKVIWCSDGHFRRAIFGLGPYIADYLEQVWLTGIVSGWCPKCDAQPTDLDGAGATDVVPFTHGFPCADIHKLLSPDLLHQAIKGTFKDHIMSWVNEYLHLVHGETHANEIIDDIDRRTFARISAIPAFPGLRRFPGGRDFSQWTGDDSKALMKVYLPAIAGHVLPKMVKCVAAFLDFFYLARRNALNTDTLMELDTALARFHKHRTIFIETGVCTDILLPWQHSLKHYSRSIRLFGSPNGLCSSRTELKHIKAVKEPW
ncbi:hypothetical protein JAAARDRAFT_191902 [Jaapia argillacea MUCL 33604]|uniref:Uncharacterized protein n=1 Tax=Jaapia argillacea MUCL 33604 TaxID=933084 RepID=A0A067Q0C9_9AGAM|nr:hypothetical protein JAAARDRAFT_191902 [Jaapia argillacea MUCL 33604]